MVARCRVWWRDFLDMAVAVGHAWWTLAVPVVAGGAITAYDRLRGTAVDLRALGWPLIIALVLAFFIAWSRRQRVLEAAQTGLAIAQRDLAEARKPVSPWRFSAEIRNLQLIGKLVPGSSNPVVFGIVHLRIKNLGADSATEDWRVSARTPSGAELDIDLRALDEPFVLDYVDGRSRTYREEHCIYIRAQNVLKSGDRVDGVLVCTFNGITRIEEVDPASVAVTFYDVGGGLWKSDDYDPAPPIATPIFYDPGLPNAERKSAT